MNKGGLGSGALIGCSLYIMTRKNDTASAAQPVTLLTSWQQSIQNECLAICWRVCSYQKAAKPLGHYLVKQPARGAVGIAPIVPKWHPDVDPVNVSESIY